jgi:hypothetical protein
MKSYHKYFILTSVYVLICWLWLFDFAADANVDFDSSVSGLLTISGIVLAVVGMWLSYSYPEAVVKITTKNEKVDFLETIESAERLQSLVMTIIMSAVVLFFCLSIVVVGEPVVTSLYSSGENLVKVKAMGTCFLWYLYALQAVTILKVIRASLSFLDDIDLLIARLDLHRQRNPHGKDEQ